MQRAERAGEERIQGVVQGGHHAISYDEAISLHTTAAADLNGESGLRGQLTAGRLADLTIWDRDPARCPGDILRDLNPTHTMLGGHFVHEPATVR